MKFLVLLCSSLVAEIRWYRKFVGGTWMRLARKCAGAPGAWSHKALMPDPYAERWVEAGLIERETYGPTKA